MLRLLDSLVDRGAGKDLEELYFPIIDEYTPAIMEALVQVIADDRFPKLDLLDMVDGPICREDDLVMGATLKYFKVHLDLEADQMEPLFLALEDKKSFCPLLRKLIVHKNPRLGEVGELSWRLGGGKICRSKCFREAHETGGF